MRAKIGPLPAWLEVAAIVLLLFSAMIEPRVTLALAAILVVVGLVAVARGQGSGTNRTG